MVEKAEASHYFLVNAFLNFELYVFKSLLVEPLLLGCLFEEGLES